VADSTLPAATWRIRTVGGGDQAWDWRDGPPQPRDLALARRTAADSMSRHAPVRMMCQTTGTFLMLESGLDYELARQLVIQVHPNLDFVAVTGDDNS
jgi:hypothetical protein